VTRNSKLFCCPEDAKAYVVVAVAGVVVVTISYPTVVGIVVPATTTFHAVRPAYSLYP